MTINLFADFDCRLLQASSDNIVSVTSSREELLSFLLSPSPATKVVEFGGDCLLLFSYSTLDALDQALATSERNGQQAIYTLLRYCIDKIVEKSKPHNLSICHARTAPSLFFKLSYPKYEHLFEPPASKALEVESAILKLANEGEVFNLTLQAELGISSSSDVRSYLRTLTPISYKNVSIISQKISDHFRSRISPVKVVVCDLDCTLWKGILREDGPNGIVVGGHSSTGRLYEYIQAMLLHLKNHGLLLCICSKNDRLDIDRAFISNPSMPLDLNDFVVVKSGDRPKSQMISEASEELNISCSQFSFLDDSRFERNEVRANLPDVIVPELPDDIFRWPLYLLKQPWFSSLGSTGRIDQRDGGARTARYKIRAQRNANASSASETYDYVNWLNSLNQKLLVTKHTVPSARALELFQRTNQFNSCHSKYSPQELQALLSRDISLYEFSVSDIHGDDGTVGLILVQISCDSVCIYDMLLSCSAFNRRIEDAMVLAISNIYASAIPRSLIFRCHPGKSNKASSDFIKRVASKDLTLIPERLLIQGSPTAIFSSFDGQHEPIV